MEQITLLQEVKMNYKKQLKRELERVNSSQASYELIMKFYPEQWREHFIAMYLDRNNRVIGWFLISSGGISGTVCDNKILFAGALNCLASSLIVCHNHPSGNLKPSSADIELTKKIKIAAKTLDMQLLDHLIITEEAYYSFADEGML
tara:strand:- start:7696 stop:8136 length:441 start_codon:yes stop_codon:yes gene_type:complete